MRLSAIVIARNEAASIGTTLQRLSAPGVELLVVDGASTDRTCEIAARYARVIASPPGRGRQLRVGARAARPDSNTFLFVHADTHLPSGYTDAIASCLADTTVLGGAFRRRFRSADRVLDGLAWIDNLRARLTRIYLGDQSLFVRRSAYADIGGFPDLSLFEDVAFSRALRRAGRTCLLSLNVRTSARRFQARGSTRTFARMLVLWALYWGGADPARLARRYGPGR